MEQFINFLNEKQRDPRLNEILYPLYDEKRATEIIDTYEQCDEAKTESKLYKFFTLISISSYKSWFDINQIFLHL